MSYKRLLTAAMVALGLGVLTGPACADKESAESTPFAAAESREPGKIGKYVKPPEDVLRARLTPLQYDVTQKEATERAFRNEYWDNKREGIYVDIVSGQPLFSSLDKYRSGTGWPSFTRPITEKALTMHIDTRLFTRRTELKSSIAGSHLGHLFDDGPLPTGKRYCINSASLRFIPRENLAAEGYAEYLSLFAR